MASNSDNAWHLDKRVNVSVIFGLLFQAVVFTTFIVGLDYRVKALEDDYETQQDVPTDLAVLTTEVTAIKEDVEDNSEQLDRIEDKIDRLQRSP